MEKLTDEDHLNLPRHCVAIIPGNHDVNRKACHAYFLHCESEGIPIVAPWWPKWRHYGTMFTEFYRDVPGVTFTTEQPWTLFEVPELKVVIAGLNSTMVEGHDCQKAGRKLDPSLPHHVGRCGERQYRWFAERLAPHQAEGWLRIGAVHHNQQRKCRDDEENLKDGELLEQVLGPSLNLLLHGHTHEAKLAWLDQHTPIISTGSAALDMKTRPGEIPNQFQVLEISARKLRCFGRAFIQERRAFAPDPRVGKSNGSQEQEITFSGVSAAFPTSEPEDEAKPPGFSGYAIRARAAGDARGDNIEGGDWVRIADSDLRSDDFLSRVAEICRFRRPAAAITQVRQPEQRLDYLRVVERTETIVRPYPVGVFEDGLTREDLDRFLAVVDAPYRAGDSGLISEIVYSGDRPAEEIIREAGRRRVRVQNFVEYQGLIDFTPYVEKQTDRLEHDAIYPPSLYVPQRMRFHIGQDESHAEDALAQVQEWLDQPHPRFVLILGDFGTGKTFLLHELARRMGHDRTGLAPLFVELRALEKAQSLDALVAQHLAKSGVDRIDLPAFRYMLQQGRIVLFFDGFDELALRVSYDRAAEHFETLVQAAAGDAKVVVTSRTQHFESDKQVRTVLYERAQPLPGLRYCKLQPFDTPQIKRFLLNRWGNEREADDWFRLLEHVKDLLGLSENPRMLGFITELKKEDIAKAKQKEGVISAADLYRLLLERWLIFEYERAHPAGSQITLTREARWGAVTAVALRLWEKTERFVTAAEIAEVASTAVAKLMTTPPPADIAGHLIGSGSLLRRNDEGCFFFVHQSVMEWLVARQAAVAVNAGERPSLFAARAISPLMAEFFCDLAGPAGNKWARREVQEFGFVNSPIKANALDILMRPGGAKSEVGNAPALKLAGQDLRGMDFAGQSLAGTDLSGADLTEARLVAKDLTGAKLASAKLVRADLTKAILVNTLLEKADLTEARLLGADLRGADIAGAVLQRSKLIATKTDEVRWDPILTFGAALPDAHAIQPLLSSPSSACDCVAWSPDGSLLATGHNDGRIRLWEAGSAKELRQLKGHHSRVRTVTFSPDGSWLASGGDDHAVHMWEVGSGKALCAFRGHQASVFSVAFSPGGEWLASGSDDNTIRLWETHTGKQLRVFRGHQARVWSLAFSPDGKGLLSGSEDHTIRLWDAGSGKEIREFAGHEDYVRSVAFSPDGQWLASGGDDSTMRLWEAYTGKELRLFKGHQASVFSVAFSPNGRLLASGSDDRTIRVWQASTGFELAKFEGHQAYVRSVAFSPDGEWLASGSADGSVWVWGVSSGKPLRRLTGNLASVFSVAFSPDGMGLVSGSAGQTIRFWEARSGKELRQFKDHLDFVRSVAFSPDGQWLASGSDDDTVRLWEVATGKELHQLTGHRGSVFAVAFSPDGAGLATGGTDGTIRLWEAASGSELRQFKGHQACVRSVAFSPNGLWVASGSDDRTVRLWDVGSGRELRRPNGHHAAVSIVAFSPDGQWLASGSGDQIFLWEVSSRSEWRHLERISVGVRCLAYTRDGRCMASGSAGGTIRLWEVDSGKELRRLTGHDASVWCVAFSPDNQRLASGSADGTVRLWRVETGECTGILLPCLEGWVAFTPQGRYKFGGNVAGNFWHAIALCRFEVGELDEFIPGLRVPDDDPLFDLGAEP